MTEACPIDTVKQVQDMFVVQSGWQVSECSLQNSFNMARCLNIFIQMLERKKRLSQGRISQVGNLPVR